MAKSEEQWEKAFQVLDHFERKLIEPDEFNWEYFIKVTGISKATMWRNENFRSQHNRVSKLIKKYKNQNLDYDLEQSKLSVREHEIEQLKKRITELEILLDRERERLAYAALIARQSNVEPDRFIEQSPLIKAQANKRKEAEIAANSKVSNAALDRFRKK